MGAQTFNQITKAQQEQPPHKLAVMKSDDERRLVFGWVHEGKGRRAGDSPGHSAGGLVDRIQNHRR